MKARAWLIVNASAKAGMPSDDDKSCHASVRESMKLILPLAYADMVIPREPVTMSF